VHVEACTAGRDAGADRRVANPALSRWLLRSGEVRVAGRKEVCRSTMKLPFCIHPAMPVFADLRPSLVLVVRTKTVPPEARSPIRR
jgi:hypothetical protein